MMKLRLAKPEHLIDINDLDELSYIREFADEIRIGALTRHVELQRSELLAEHFPVFADAEAVIADPVVRNRGTIGGSLCQADAAEDLQPVCSAVNGAGRDPRRRRRAGGRRWTSSIFGPVHDRGRRRPRCSPRSGSRCSAGGGSAHEKTERRAGDWAIAAASAAVWIDGGTIAEAGIALSAVGPTTVHLTRAPRSCCGERPRPRSCSRRRGRSRPRTARRAPTAADRSTTSAISPAS